MRELRRRLMVVILLLIAVLFSSCKAVAIEDMLLAPSLNEVQRAVAQAVNAVSRERVVYKYPAGGDWRAPIQFFDLDNDGVDEAIVFYAVQAESLNAYLAVLGRDDAGGWSILSTIEGEKTDVNFVEPIESGETRNLLVEWSSNRTEKKVSVYNFEDGKLSEGFNEECSVILPQDLDGDGVTEFLYITAEKQGESFALKYVDNDGDDFTVGSEAVLKTEMLSYLSLRSEKSADGRRLIYVDEGLDEGVNATEVFELKDRELSKVNVGDDLDIFKISMRKAESPAVISRSFSGIGPEIMVPSDAAPYENIVDETLWKYWYQVEDGTLTHRFTTYVNTSFNFLFGVPVNPEDSGAVEQDNPIEASFDSFSSTDPSGSSDAVGDSEDSMPADSSDSPGLPLDETTALPDIPRDWPRRVVIIENEAEQRLFQIISAATRDVIFELKVLLPADSPAFYEENGFESIQHSAGGAYRYYYKANGELCSKEEEQYILDSFYFGIAN